MHLFFCSQIRKWRMNNSSHSCPWLNSTDFAHVQRIYQSLSLAVYEFVPIFLCFMIIAFAVNILFVHLTVRKLRQRRLPRKRYYFELNRSVADLVSISVAICGGLAIASNPKTSYTVLNISILVVANSTFISIWTLTNTYVSMTVLQYFAIAKPLVYNLKITAKNCFLVIIVCWIISFVAGPLLEIIYFQNLCTDVCLDYLAIMYITLISNSYFITLFVYLIVLGLLNNQNRNSSFRTNRYYGMKKLALYLILYTIAYLPMVIIMSVYWKDVAILFYLLKQRTLCDFEQTLLSAIEIDSNFGNNIKTIAWSYFLWNIRALWDPVTTVIMEPELRNSFRCTNANNVQRNVFASQIRTVSRNYLFE